MIHENIKIDIDYEKLGIKHKGADAVFTTYIKEMYPDYQNVFERPLVIICPGGGYEHHSPREYSIHHRIFCEDSNGSCLYIA